MGQPKNIDPDTRLSAIEIKLRRFEEYLDEHSTTTSNHSQLLQKAISSTDNASPSVDKILEHHQSTTEEQNKLIQKTIESNTKEHSNLLKHVLTQKTILIVMSVISSLNLLALAYLFWRY